eukprot:gene6114-10121_t
MNNTIDSVRKTVGEKFFGKKKEENLLENHQQELNVDETTHTTETQTNYGYIMETPRLIFDKFSKYDFGKLPSDFMTMTGMKTDQKKDPNVTQNQSTTEPGTKEEPQTPSILSFQGLRNHFGFGQNRRDAPTGAVRKSTRGGWTEEEDEILKKAVKENDEKNWKRVSEQLEGRTPIQCLHRWQKVLNPFIVKGPWSEEEDKICYALVQKHGANNWTEIAEHIPGRIGKQCRERWLNHLDPSINKEPFSEEEERILIDAQRRLGNKWKEMTSLFNGRTDNQLKNQFKLIRSHQKTGKRKKERPLTQRPSTSTRNGSYPRIYGGSKSKQSSNSVMQNNGQMFPYQQTQNNLLSTSSAHNLSSQSVVTGSTTNSLIEYTSGLFDDDDETDASSLFTFTETDQFTSNTLPTPLDFEELDLEDLMNFPDWDEEDSSLGLDSFQMFNLGGSMISDEPSAKKQKQE